MWRLGLSLAVAIAALAVAPASEALAKEVCCYRVHANTSNAIQHVDQGGSGAGAQNGTYSMSTQWEVRELMSYVSKGRGNEFLVPVMTRNQRNVRGTTRFSGSERSDQWYMDPTTTPPTRVDYPPCRYSRDVPWRRGGGVRLVQSGGARFFVILSGGVFWAYCDNTSPLFSPDSQWYHPGGGATASGSDDSYWDAEVTNINTVHTSERFGVSGYKKLRKMKDQVVRFEPPTITETSQQPPYTATITHRTVIRFNWFPYDRLQKELNELNGLK